MESYRSRFAGESLIDLAAVETRLLTAPQRGILPRYRAVARWIALTDGGAILAAFLTAYVIRFGVSPIPVDFLLIILIAPPLWLTLFVAWRLYGIHRLPAAEEFRRLVAAISVGVSALVTVSFWSKSSFSRLWIGLAWALSVVFVLVERRLWRDWIRRRRVDGTLAFKTLIIGGNEEALHVTEVLSSGARGFRPLGLVTTDRADAAAASHVPILGGVPSLREIIRETDADCLFVASGGVTPAEMQAVAKVARREAVELRVTANLPETHSSRVTPQPVAGLMTLALQPVHLTGPQAALKRAVDVLASSLGIIVLSPLFALLSVAVWTSSPGPILFRQERTGRRGRSFRLLKFRTMVVDAEERRDALLGLNQASGPLFKIDHDPRVTRVGRVLRRWSLDELPQLFNVLAGDMSLVGPRPPLPKEVAEYEEWHFDRLEVRPGMTGLWQVSGRAELTFDDYVRLDLFYIENWSLASDLFLLLKTVPAVFHGRGSY